MTKIKKPASETETDPKTPSKEQKGTSYEELMEHLEAYNKRYGLKPLSLEEVRKHHSENLSVTVVIPPKKPKD